MLTSLKEEKLVFLNHVGYSVANDKYLLVTEADIFGQFVSQRILIFTGVDDVDKGLDSDDLLPKDVLELG